MKYHVNQADISTEKIIQDKGIESEEKHGDLGQVLQTEEHKRSPGGIELAHSGNSKKMGVTGVQRASEGK